MGGLCGRPRTRSQSRSGWRPILPLARAPVAVAAVAVAVAVVAVVAVAVVAAVLLGLKGGPVALNGLSE